MSTFCVMIQEEIVVSTCPLKKGECYWQHVETNSCKYSLHADDIPLTEFCDRTGRVPLSESEYTAKYEQLKSVLRP